jgi:hypothetical protein
LEKRGTDRLHLTNMLKVCVLDCPGLAEIKLGFRKEKKESSSAIELAGCPKCPFGSGASTARFPELAQDRGQS